MQILRHKLNEAESNSTQKSVEFFKFGSSQDASSDNCGTENKIRRTRVKGCRFMSPPPVFILFF